MPQLLYGIGVLFFFFASTSLKAQSNSFTPPTFALTDFQLYQVLDLLDATKEGNKKNLRRYWAEESKSKILMDAGYEMAKGFSKILHLDNVPFKLVTASVNFMSCWSNNNLKKTDECWSLKYEKLTHVSYDQFDEIKSVVGKKDLRLHGSYEAFANQNMVSSLAY